MKTVKLKRLLYIILFGAVPALIIVLSIPKLLIKDKTIFPNDDIKVVLESDVYTQGNSKITQNRTTEEKIEFDYILEKGFEVPYVKASLRKNVFLSLEDYDQLKLIITSKYSKTLRCQILIYFLNYKSLIHPESNIVLQNELALNQQKNKNEYFLDINNFSIPDWWYKKYGVQKNDKIIRINFNQVLSINILSDLTLPLGQSDTIVIEEITCQVNKPKHIIKQFIFLVIYLLSCVIIIKFIKQKHRKLKQVKSGAKGKNRDSGEEELTEEERLLIQYIGENYNNSALSIAGVSEACSISKFKIPVILNDRFNLTFPQYLTSIRIAEAKRLMLETDMKVFQIAMKVGYDHITHFHRTFKQIEGVTPAKFRKNNIKK